MTRISLLIIKSQDTSNGKIGHFLASLFADSTPFPMTSHAKTLSDDCRVTLKVIELYMTLVNEREQGNSRLVLVYWETFHWIICWRIWCVYANLESTEISRKIPKYNCNIRKILKEIRQYIYNKVGVVKSAIF
jgi:hypothetical protein